MKMGEALYKAQAAEAQAPPAARPAAAAPASAGGGGGGAAGGAKSDKVVDADFEEVDPNKKKPG